MISIIVASHGDFAKGLLMSGEMIVGHQKDIQVCCLMPNEGPHDLKRKILQAVSSLSNQDEVLFLVDLWGGTPCNQIQVLLENHTSWAMIAGVNLPMLIETLMVRESMDHAKDLMKHILSVQASGIRCIPDIIKDTKTCNQAIHKNNIKKGYMEYVLARIDSRLLHGQVATNWVKYCQPNRIIVVSDQVSHDQLRKKMIKEAAPVGVKAHVIPISKMIELDRDDRFGDTRTLLLFENVEDVVKVVEAGVRISTINLGSLAHSKGKVIVSSAVSMDEKDIVAFEKIIKRGIQIDVRKVPNDMPENFEQMLQKAKRYLKGDHL